jgi:hypothetical protein
LGVSFVNNSGAERHEDSAASGEPIDFDPNDPDVVKVHYDLTVWTFDQRAELSEALADAEFPHYWDGSELVVPEVVEDDVDALFERLEQLFGPFPIILQDDEESTEFGLDEWSEADRKALTDALIDSEIPHRWDGTTVIVAADAESAVDVLLDRIETGELGGGTTDGGVAPPEGALSTMFVAADKLAKDPLDTGARTSLLDLLPQLDPKHPPYGIAVRTWAEGVAGVGRLVELIDDHAQQTGTDESFESEMIGAAQGLRALVRPLV